jgi:hypothetical protein
MEILNLPQGGTTMEKYTTASARELAERLLLMGTGGEITFATKFETDGDGNILHGSAEDWFGAKIIRQFNGTCLLISDCGGGRWFPYDITRIYDDVPLDVLQSAFSSCLTRSLHISDGKICVEEWTDSQLEEIWADLEDIPFDESDDMVLSVDWRGFPKGTTRETIWRFLDKNHSKGVACLLYGESGSFEMEVSISCDDGDGCPFETTVTGESILSLKDGLDKIVTMGIRFLDSTATVYRVEIQFTEDGEYADDDATYAHYCHITKKLLCYKD